MNNIIFELKIDNKCIQNPFETDDVFSLLLEYEGESQSEFMSAALLTDTGNHSTRAS